MKRLFQVGNEFFESKKAAKAARGEYKPGGAHVTKGPDHWSFGVRKVGTTHSNAMRKK